MIWGFARLWHIHPSVFLVVWFVQSRVVAILTGQCGKQVEIGEKSGGTTLSLSGQKEESSILQRCRAFPVWLPIMLSMSLCQLKFHTRKKRNQPKQVWLRNSKGETRSVRFQVFYLGFVFVFYCWIWEEETPATRWIGQKMGRGGDEGHSEMKTETQEKRNLWEMTRNKCIVRWWYTDKRTADCTVSFKRSVAC